jgi:phosphoribosylanthranilate isomerase
VTQVKICGIMNIETGVAAASAGADYLGLVFAPSARRLAPEIAAEISAASHDQKLSLKVVGVFVNQPAQEVNKLARTCQLDLVQLSGNESWDYCKMLELPIMKAVHVSATTSRENLLEHVMAGRQALGDDLIFLLDTQVSGSFGGTGRLFDWDLARGLPGFQIIVAGGLTPDNVGNLVAELNPWGVDVSSGVETDGQKDLKIMRDFIKIAKSARGMR